MMNCIKKIILRQTRRIVYLNKLKKMHLNVLKTIYFNFKVFKLREAIKLPVFLFGDVQMEGLRKGCVRLKNPSTGTVKIGGGRCTELYGFSEIYKSYLRIEGVLSVDKDVVIDQGCILSINKGAVVEIGKNIFINRNVKIHSKSSIIIEDNCRCGWDVQIIDTNFHYSINSGKIFYRNGSIFIGHNSWITNGVSIMKDSYLPPYSVVASKSIVNKNFKECGEMCLYGGSPAKHIKNDFRRILGCERIIDALFKNNEYLLYDDIKSILNQ